jgi:hypothetical protein
MKRLLVLCSTLCGLAAVGVYFYWKRNANKTRELVAKERVQVLHVARGIRSFESWIGLLPTSMFYEKGQDTRTDTSPEDLIGSILTGRDLTGSLPRHNFLPDFPEAIVVDGRPVSGFYEPSEGLIALCDSWGRYYQLLLDSDYDGRVRDPSRPGENLWIERMFLVWSSGPDGNPNTWDDNICSWK